MHGFRYVVADPMGAGLERILTSAVVAVEAEGDAPPEELIGAERDAVARAHPRRVQEFARARTCARRALRKLGLGEVAIPVGAVREPLWPVGVVGAITHCNGYCCAVVARADRFVGVGVDTENLQALEAGVRAKVLTPSEQRALCDLPGSVDWSVVYFSAKEAFFKAWYPDTRLWLGFLDAEVILQPELGTFSITLTGAPAPASWKRQAFLGRFCFSRERVMSFIGIERDEAGG